MQLDSLELIGYDPESGTFPSTVYANMSPQPLPYRWEVEGDALKISVSYGPLDDVHRQLLRRRPELRGELAPQPRRRRDGERSLRHRWTPHGVARQTAEIPRRAVVVSLRAVGKVGPSCP
jgi:hypothetical protein